MRNPNRSWLVAAIVLVATLLSVNAWAGKRIGVLLFSDEARYLEAAQGIKDTLSKAGYAESTTQYMVEKAGANKAKAVELVQKLAREKLDLVFAVGSTSAVLAAREIRDVPVVFSVVYDPVDLGIAKAWKSSGNNTTGTSSKVPMVKVLESLKLLRPLKRLAVLYTVGEKNSESTLKDLQNCQENAGIRIIPVLVTTREDIDQLLPEVLQSVDGVYITGSNVVTTRVETIVDMATKAGVITVSHLEDMVEKGVLLGVCADAYAMGRLAGEKAVMVLRGEKPSSIPIEVLSTFDIVLNMKTLRAGKFLVPPAFMKSVTRKVE
jgi:putative tryptophan/tyrosine transport system substrate-binding protein